MSCYLNLSKNLILVQIERYSVVLRHANHYSKLLYILLYYKIEKGVKVSIVN